MNNHVCEVATPENNYKYFHAVEFGNRYAVEFGNRYLNAAVIGNGHLYAATMGNGCLNEIVERTLICSWHREPIFQ